VCIVGVEERNRKRAKFSGCLEDVVSVMDVTSLSFLHRLASSRLVFMDDLQSKTKIQTNDYTCPSV
jgi:hypothetical protein